MKPMVPLGQVAFGTTEEQNVQLLGLIIGEEQQYSAPQPNTPNAEKPMRPQNEPGGDCHLCSSVESECNSDLRITLAHCQLIPP